MLLVSACGTSASPSAGGGDGTTVNVTLQEWAVVPAASSAPAGEIVFHITNDGPADIHEFVVMKTDLEPGDLPTDDTGKVDEEGEGIEEVMGEVEDLAVDASEDLTLTLEAGSYVLLCNIYSEEEQEAHYAEGMRIAFTVE
jgi:uncharacterized cupredoxin-like copper-binding protein